MMISLCDRKIQFGFTGCLRPIGLRNAKLDCINYTQVCLFGVFGFLLAFAMSICLFTP